MVHSLDGETVGTWLEFGVGDGSCKRWIISEKAARYIGVVGSVLGPVVVGTYQARPCKASHGFYRAAVCKSYN